MLRKMVALAALVLITLLAAPLVLAQQEDTSVDPSESAFTPTFDTSGGAGVDQFGGACASFDHVPGEFIVQYDSEEAMWAAPQENVVETLSPSLLMQLLRFEDIASITDPCQRFAAEEEMRQEILAWPGVQNVDYNFVSQLTF